MGNWSQANWSLKSWNNRARSFCGRDAAAEAAAEAAAAALLAAQAAARAAADLEREVNEHHEAHALKRYRAAMAARASAAMQQTPAPEPLPPTVIDVVPSQAAIDAAVAKLRSLRQPSVRRESFTGGITLPIVPWG